MGVDGNGCGFGCECGCGGLGVSRLECQLPVPPAVSGQHVAGGINCAGRSPHYRHPPIRRLISADGSANKKLYCFLYEL